ncbi:insecticidal toxin complex protein C [Mycoavidus cysteinexigens]|uniref:Insecticidal toxin complex protein C n=1 Tax=Mycoavidus cysteinexigens TaxID=1553431 RepID=A0A2Z6EY71_9BURK|nr:RHS repeat domain-containing protein [Mycoavidus cysteinexigens]BBE10380.1 insecticidal toxin complex protein C [Mycoavidus cysteinexigens]GAM53249.1 putative insecticidal toxin complex protein TccC [bacterium endosymbiont of Mortierella elongata FMR23-6]GLR00455.1 hypothetical protein GCM10007934_02660 [Mycoavidus cysteinexigens]
MASTFLPELHAGTPTVSICDNRGLAVRELAWHRTAVSGSTDTRITRHQYNIHGQLVQSTDPRLYAAKQLDDRGKPNFTWRYDLAGSPLRTEGGDVGRTISLSDVEGRPLLAVTAMDVIQRWHYEDDTLPGRPLAASELKPGQETLSITERFIWAGNTQTEKDHNLAGQCACHYDTAGLNRLESLSLTGATLSQSRQLLADDQEAHWEGSSEDTWQAMLAEKVYLTQSTTDATGAPLTQTDAIGNQQRLAYDVAGHLMGSWLTLAGEDEDEQVIVKSLMYSAAGQKVREEHGNGVVTEYTYELETQHLTGITTRRPAGHSSGAKLLQDLRYEYDPVGNVIGLRNEAEATQFWRNQKVAPENTYTYDTLYQLTRATGREMVNIGHQGSHLPTLMAPFPVDSSVYTNYTRTYTYDPGGNLSQIQHSAPATNNNYTTDITVSDRSNRAVLSQPGLTPGGVDALFDAGGNQKSLLPGQPLVWNSRGELQQVTPVNREEDASDQERYRYGGDGMRVLKIRERKTRSVMQIQRVTYLPGLELRTTHNGTTTTEDLHVLTVGEAGRAQVRVLHWESVPPSGVSNNQIRYSYDNLTGSSGLESDGRGETISQEEYYPYGGTAVWMARSRIEADYKTVRYSGKERDETGLYYYGYRYYQPWVGRWLNPDPAGTIDGLNLYKMVRNNPVRFYDKDGLVPSEPDKRKITNIMDVTSEFKRDDASLLKNNVLSGFKLKPPLLENKYLADLKAGVGQVFLFSLSKYTVESGHSVVSLDMGNLVAESMEMASGGDGREFINAFWAPQGGYVDVPIHPSKEEAKIVFTPDFSGCSLMVNQIQKEGREFYRFRHVEGSKERQQFFELNSKEEWGLGLAANMNYEDYGISQNQENTRGFAYAIYSEITGNWVINWQGQSNVSSSLTLDKKAIIFMPVPGQSAIEPVVLATGSKKVDILNRRRTESFSGVPHEAAEQLSRRGSFMGRLGSFRADHHSNF